MRGHMKLDALTQRLLDGIPCVLKEATVSRDELGDRATHHSVIRITGAAEMTRDRLLEVITRTLGVELRMLHSDADSHTIEIADKSGARMCARFYRETSQATIATYSGPETRPLDESAAGREQILRLKHTG